MPEMLLSLSNISKSFGAVRALDDVRFDLLAGEVHALMGENGAGKSTLMNILGGVIRPDAGQITMTGLRIRPQSPMEAQRLGIGLVHQEIALCPDISVAENIFMAETSRSGRMFMKSSDLRARAEAVLAPLHPLPVAVKAGSLPIASQQIVEIAKALTLDCKILIFDEPTAALTEAEAERLFKLIRSLRDKGIGIIYVSHRMAEIFALSDRITVFRDGTYVETVKTCDTTPQEVASRMVGRALPDLYPPKSIKIEHAPRLTVETLSDDCIKDISFSVFPGEILGFGGLIGSGRSEIAQSVCGLRPKAAGTIRMDGKPITLRNYRDAIENRIVYLSEDRKGNGVFLDLSIAENISALDLNQVSRRWSIDPKRETSQAEEMKVRLDIRCASVHQAVGTLSGGNQQKVALAKLLAVDPLVLFVDEPTRGVDIGAKAQIYAILRDLAAKGAAIVMISSELTELIGLSDRVLVLHEGRIVGEVRGETMTEENIMQMASGLAQEEAK